MANTIPPALIEEFQRNNVVIFLGSGMSQNSGAPGWNDILNELRAAFIGDKSPQEIDFYKKLDNLEKAQYLYDKFDKTPIIKKMKDILSRVEFCDLHRLLVRLPWATMVTTNWDDLVEKACASSGIGCIKIWKDDQVPLSGSEEKTIIKIHGSLDDPCSVVFSESDYASFPEKNRLMQSLFGTLLAYKAILFVGYSYNDYNLKSIVSFVKNSLGDLYRKPYILTLNEDCFSEEYLEKRGLQCISFRGNGLDKRKLLEEFLYKIKDEVLDFADNRKSRLELVYRENKKILSSKRGVILRNMANFGPLATPLSVNDERVFDDYTELEVKCAENWKSILDLPGSSAKLILCLDETRYKNVYAKSHHLRRIEILMENIEKFEDKIEVVDFGHQVINNLDIYGKEVCLESVKADAGKKTYSFLRIHRGRKEIDQLISIFDGMFENAKKMNSYTYGQGKKYLWKRFIMDKLNSMRKRVSLWED